MPSDRQGRATSGAAVPCAEERAAAPASTAFRDACATPVRSRRRVGRVTAAALLVLVACGAGIGAGYVVFRPSGSTGTSSAAPGPPVTSAGAAAHVAAVAARVDPGLVDVDTTLGYQAAYGAGTGMVVTPSGEVVTNNHVIEGETSLHVTDIGNDRTYAATVVGYDVAADVAVLQIEGASDLRTVSFAQARPRIGQPAVAIGNAGGRGGTPAAVPGRVIGLDRQLTAKDGTSGTTEHLRKMIESDAPIRQGDSGGPLVNATGDVLGMDTAGSSRAGQSRRNPEAFAVPVGVARAVAGHIEHGRSSSALHIGPTSFIGVVLTTIDTAGAIVAKVLPGTPASAIGLSAGDSIVSLAGRAIRSAAALSRVLESKVPGASIEIGWQDPQGHRCTATVTLASGPPA